MTIERDYQRRDYALPYERRLPDTWTVSPALHIVPLRNRLAANLIMFALGALTFAGVEVATILLFSVR